MANDPLLTAVVGVPLFGTPIVVVIAWWLWFRRDRNAYPHPHQWRVAWLFIGLLAASTNAFMFYSWAAYRMIAGASPAVWRVKALLGDNVAGWLIVVALAGATIGKGKARIPVAISALTGFLLWIRLGFL